MAKPPMAETERMPEARARSGSSKRAGLHSGGVPVSTKMLPPGRPTLPVRVAIAWMR
jgi:hypothetical protein